MSQSKTLRNFFDLIKNGARILGIAYGHVPWISSIQILLTIILSVVPFLAFKELGRLIDAMVSGVESGSLALIWLPFIAYIILNILPAILSAWQRYGFRNLFLKMQDRVDMMILRKRASFSISQYEDPKFLDSMQKAFNQSYFPLLNILEGSINMIGTVVGVIFGFAVAFIIDWKVLVIVILTSIPTFLVEVRYGNKVWTIFGKNSPEQRRMQDLRRFFAPGNRYAVIDGKLQQIAENFLGRIQKILNDFTSEQLSTESKRLVYGILAALLAGLGIFAAMFMIIKSAVAGIIAIGTVVYAFQTLSRISGQISQLLASIATLLERNLYVTDIFGILDTEPTIKQPLVPKSIPDLGGKAPHIKFDNVSFKYPGQDSFALKNISFELLPGEKLGLVGNNGSGKSTLVRMLLRVHDPIEGRITVNGLDLREIATEDWWSYLSVLLQDFTTYYFSVTESVAIGRKDKPIDAEVVDKSIDQSTLGDFVAGLEKKKENMIGIEFGGVEPSKGQRQKLAIARAFYREPALLILDEPTASIDSQSATKIFATIEALPSNRSAILISHNFATIKRASKIIVLEKGVIMESGTHDELMKKEGMYSKAYLEQKMDFA
ncbi:MAG: ABC transporter ATP-binding protein [Candidatus Paceibacterota bacterium]